MKRGEKRLFFLALVILFSLLIIGFALAEDNLSAASDGAQSSSDAKTSAEFNVEPGMTPDNPLYFIKDVYQQIVVGDNPERALDYREQKIAEAQVMVEKEKPEEAKRVLDRALQYGDIVAKEISPDLKDEVAARSEIVQNAMEDLKEKTEDVGVQQKFDENLEKEKKIMSASELVAKINELCDALAKLDPLQYADACRPKTDSPKWMKENDKAITKEQQAEAKIFFDKLSACFENPEKCDCKGMGVQKFEDFCLEKSAIVLKCKNDDENACKELGNSDPSDLLPDYLLSVFREVEKKYMKSQFDMYMPEECVKAGAKTPEGCNSVIFKLDSPKECIDAGLTGRTKEDEIKCKQIMFEKDSPKECIDAGITSEDNDAPRKCSKVMFQKYASQECLDAGLTGESRDDQRKCNEMLSKNNLNQNGTSATNFAPQFKRDCNAIQDSTEKMKCYEEFYNNAQVQIKDDFRAREMIDQSTGETITPEEEAQRKACRDKGMGTILEHENGNRVVICVDKNQPGTQANQAGMTEEDKARQECMNKGMDTILENENGKRVIICVDKNSGTQAGGCQGTDQTEKLKQDCKDRGQEGRVETKGGCPWVICVSNSQGSAATGGGGQGVYIQGGQSSGQVPSQQQNVQQSNQGTKCPDNICDDYEKMNPYACPEDCGGQRQPGDAQQQQPGNYQPPQNIIENPQPNQQPVQNIIDNPQQPGQQPGQQFCEGQAPSCAPNGAPFCENGNWVCPQPQQPQQPLIEPQPVQPPLEPQPIEPQPPAEPVPVQEEPAPATSGGGGGESSTTTAPVTGGVISGDNADNLNKFLVYWWR